jgi:hypothetical protein
MTPEHPWESSKQEQTKIIAAHAGASGLLVGTCMVSFQTQLHAHTAFATMQHAIIFLWVAPFFIAGSLEIFGFMVIGDFQ